MALRQDRGLPGAAGRDGGVACEGVSPGVGAYLPRNHGRCPMRILGAKSATPIEPAKPTTPRTETAVAARPASPDQFTRETKTVFSPSSPGAAATSASSQPAAPASRVGALLE